MSTPDELRELVESYLAELALTPELKGLEESMRHALAGGGKRVRPVLCLALRRLELRLDLLGDLRQLGQDLDRLVGILRLLEPGTGSLEPVEQLLCALQALLRAAHACASFSMRPSMPFTSLPASSDE